MDKLLQRSNGEINIELFDNNFKKFFQSGCCKILNPNNYNKSKELVLINTAGGITCNDNIEINATIHNSELSICTQAAEKIYSGIGDPAKVNININLNNSTLYWLPKELILFDNSKLRRSININLLKIIQKKHHLNFQRLNNYYKYEQVIQLLWLFLYMLIMKQWNVHQLLDPKE